MELRSKHSPPRDAQTLPPAIPDAWLARHACQLARIEHDGAPLLSASAPTADELGGDSRKSTAELDDDDLAFLFRELSQVDGLSPVAREGLLANLAILRTIDIQADPSLISARLSCIDRIEDLLDAANYTQTTNPTPAVTKVSQ